MHFSKRLFLYAVFAFITFAARDIKAIDIVISTPVTTTQTPASGDTVTVTNTGSITLSGNGVNVNTTNVGTITNNGTITANRTGSTANTGVGINLTSNSSVTNGIVNNGTIFGATVGIGTPGNPSNVSIAGGITNRGLIYANTANVASDAPAADSIRGMTLTGGITNTSTGVIKIDNATSSTTQFGILFINSTVSGGINNSGLIKSTGNDGIRIQGGNFSGGITNNAGGSIWSNVFGGIQVMASTTVNGNIDNSGAIEGLSGLLFRSGMSGDILNRSGGTITGSNGNGINIGSTAAATLAGTIDNAGTISGTLNGITMGFAGSRINNGITNSGTITAPTALNLINNGGAFTVANTGNINGAAALGINTLNLNGTTARVTGATSGAGATVNVNGNFTSENTFNFNTFNVNSGGTFVMNNNVTAGAGNFNNAGTLQVDSGKNVSLTGTLNNTGTAIINGDLTTSAMNLSGGATLKGSGSISGSIGGSGSVNPGNSPGILTAGSVNPSSGLSFNFEMTGFDPNFSNVAGSVNDVLRLTAATAFSSVLASGNSVSLYFNQSTINNGEVFTGGFFTDTAADFTSSIQNATFNYYIMGDGSGSAVTYNGQGYYLLSSYLSSVSFTLGTSAVSAPFSSGTVNGFVMNLSASTVPEPSNYALGMIASATMAFVARRRKQKVTA